MFAQSLRDPNELVYVARDPAHKVVSYINLARNTGVALKTAEVNDTYRRYRFCAAPPPFSPQGGGLFDFGVAYEMILQGLKEASHAKCEAAVMPGMNGPLLIELWEKLDCMAEQVMRGRGDFWMVDNVGTLQSHQGRGIASALLRTALELCEDKPVLLDTSGDEDGRAWPLYEKLGSTRVGEFEIDLSRHGSQGLHRHFGMVREPRRL